jgi:hypothetical protein
MRHHARRERLRVRRARLAAWSLAVALAGARLHTLAGDFPELRGPYLGQQPPAAGAAVFAAGILKPAEGFHSSVVFNAAGDTACWTEMGGTTYCSSRVDERWTNPEMLPFDPEYGVGEPMFAHQDRRLYFLSRRPLPNDPVVRERSNAYGRAGRRRGRSTMSSPRAPPTGSSRSPPAATCTSPPRCPRPAAVRTSTWHAESRTDSPRR